MSGSYPDQSALRIPGILRRIVVVRMFPRHHDYLGIHLTQINSGHRRGPATPGSRDPAGDGFGIAQSNNVLCGHGELFRVLVARTDDR